MIYSGCIDSHLQESIVQGIFLLNVLFELRCSDRPRTHTSASKLRRTSPSQGVLACPLVPASQSTASPKRRRGLLLRRSLYFATTFGAVLGSCWLNPHLKVVAPLSMMMSLVMPSYSSGGGGREGRERGGI